MSKQFVERVRKSEISMRPILPLGLPVDLGHVGTISEDGTFSHRGTIESILGLNSLGGELPVQNSPLRIAVTSGKDVSVAFGIDAKTDGILAQFGKLKGKASISFGGDKSFFLAVNGLKIRQLKEPHLLINAVLTAYGMNRWERDWVFIHRVGVAHGMTVVLATEANTSVLFKASANVAAVAAVDVDLAAGFKFVVSTKAVTQITGGRNYTGFFDAYRVKDPWFLAPRIEQYRIAGPFGLDLDTYPEEIVRLDSSSQAFAQV